MTRVLLVRLSALGDVVQSLGAVRSLREALPDAELGFAVQRPFAALLEGSPGIAAVFAHDRRSGPGGYLRTGRALRRFRPDVALDLQGNWKSAGLAFLSRAPRRIGADRAARREPGSRVLLTETVRAPDRHPARVAAALVRHLAPGAVEHAPTLVASEAEVQAAAADVRALGVDPKAPFHVVVGSDPDDPRALHPALVARALRRRPAVLLLGPADPPPDPVPDAPVLRHPPGALRRLVGLGALLRGAGGDVLGPDRGASHVLAAAGARTTVAYGPTSAERTGPPAARALRRADVPPCAPCHARRCRHPDGPVCRVVDLPPDGD